MPSTQRRNLALEQLRRTVARQSRELRRLTLQLQAAEQRERARIAEQLHQDLQQLLAAANLKLFTLQRQLPDSAHRQALEQTQALLEQAITSTRCLAAGLAPPALQESLPAALHWLAEKMQHDHNLRVDLHVEPGCDVPDLPRRELLFQSLRELLFNVHKHAGVQQATLTVRRCPRGGIEATVFDQGKGTADHQPGFGLRTMRARLHHLGGALEITSTPASGTTARILLPL